MQQVTSYPIFNFSFDFFFLIDVITASNTSPLHYGQCALQRQTLNPVPHSATVQHSSSPYSQQSSTPSQPRTSIQPCTAEYHTVGEFITFFQSFVDSEQTFTVNLGGLSLSSVLAA